MNLFIWELDFLYAIGICSKYTLYSVAFVEVLPLIRMEVATPAEDDAVKPVTTEASSSQEKSSAAAVIVEEDEPVWVCSVRRVLVILGGEKTIASHQEFIIRNNHTDLQILRNSKVKLQV